MQQPKLSARGISLWFGEKQVLKDIDIGFQDRQITALIGPSGCGKSTLLRCFNRMHDRTPGVRLSGHCYLDQEDIYAKSVFVAAIRRRIGMVFQKANPFAKSIYENINYGLKINGVQENQRHELIVQSLKESFLWDEVQHELHKPAAQLSGGQQQRLCIARAVALRPEVILMDEPCSALDPLSTAKIEELIKNLKADYTIVIVTHNMQQAQRIADNTVFMYMGRIIEADTTPNIFNNATNELTSSYVHGKFG
ncbi:phosphate ABC transporter ATP-binding protein PstB [Mucilaginibacter aquariorum]|uniref:Phosphate ABC transporter ATP-binding protein PstB n=1 Tax=Mucilaginibacter aquariorum TaxID=2967225 RepID=A0ABT1T2B1_9SPHI|nr:phosphate ABC transporter ATP-binding protein PstB [Mucilaginibacter aquariorum]MCQ6958750.1 phosphate ABC transporter ATP-binding protein PstB [Mucilaginibacter aquariorum]